MDYPLITVCSTLDRIIDQHAADLEDLYPAYRNHSYRMLNLMAGLARQHLPLIVLQVVAACHALPSLVDDSASSASDLAGQCLDDLGQTPLQSLARHLINVYDNSAEGPHSGGWPFDCARAAHQIDETRGRLAFGLPHGYIEEIGSTFPSLGPCPRPATIPH